MKYLNTNRITHHFLEYVGAAWRSWFKSSLLAFKLLTLSLSIQTQTLEPPTNIAVVASGWKQEITVTDIFLYAISESLVEKAESVQQKMDFFTKLFNPSRTLLQERINHAPKGPVHELTRIFQFGRSSKDTYGCLREKLDKFSIFCGRNPLVSGCT